MTEPTTNPSAAGIDTVALKKPQKTVTLIALTPIIDDPSPEAEPVMPGEEFDCEEKEADKLVKAGKAARPAEAPEKKAKKAK